MEGVFLTSFKLTAVAAAVTELEIEIPVEDTFIACSEAVLVWDFEDEEVGSAYSTFNAASNCEGGGVIQLRSSVASVCVVEMLSGKMQVWLLHCKLQLCVTKFLRSRGDRKMFLFCLLYKEAVVVGVQQATFGFGLQVSS